MRRSRSVWTWMVAILIAVPVSYFASFGPACWWFAKEEDSVAFSHPELFIVISCAPRIYWPIGWLMENAPKPIGPVIAWYAGFGNPGIHVPVSPDGTVFVSH